VQKKFNQTDIFKSLQDDLGATKSTTSGVPSAISVSQLTEQIKDNLEENFSNVMVEGELSNVSKPSSGHIYATLKDKNAQISIVIFRSTVAKIKFQLKDGQEVNIKGQITVYHQRGSYQIIVQNVTPKGMGSLQLAFEQLKKKLEVEGLFDLQRKRPIPFLPTKIGLVTSLTGAAIKDFLTTVKARCPIVDVILIPVKVQGENSALEIAAAIQKFNYLKNVDVIVVGRGGGSLEDLWSFNEEIVARSIFYSAIPIISAVGHETDVSLSDFVADVKAMTPTHAGVICVPDIQELKRDIFKYCQKFFLNMQSLLKENKLKIKNFEKSFTKESFENRFRNHKLHCDNLEMRLKAALVNNWNQYENRFTVVKTRFQRIMPLYIRKINEQRKVLNNHKQVVISGVSNIISNKRKKLEYLSRSLDLLSPLKTIDRGYAIVKIASTNELLQSVTKAAKGDTIMTMVTDGKIFSIVDKIELKKEKN
jgi:exodeoxyribonuclease VII large subunit